MIFFPPAKINLGLQILRKRGDGYHDIASCMLQIPLYDVLEILPSKVLEFRQSGLEIPDAPEANLVRKAHRLLQEYCQAPPAYFHLRKHIPMGAGLGGGSSDAAYTLVGMNEVFKLGLSSETLQELSAHLGSDCAFFIEGKAQLAEGRGEVLSPLSVDLSGYYLKLIHPGVHVSTAEAYAGVTPRIGGPALREILTGPIETWKEALHNDFEDSIFPRFPEIKALKDAMYKDGALYASMSGSGSSVFGIFTVEPKKSNPGLSEWVLAL